MLEGLTYFASLVLFGFVVLATTRVRHEMLILACIPPVFVALVMGFVMAIYAGGRFGVPLVAVALALPIPAAWQLARRYSERDLLILIFLAWALGMVFALVAFGFPDSQ
jgi:hypothetical protein